MENRQIKSSEVKQVRPVNLFKPALFIILLFISFSKNAAASDAQLKVVSSSWPPIKIHEEDKQTGIANDVLKEIAKRMNLEIYYFDCPWRRCLELLKAGKADITVAHKAPEREEYLYAIDPPLMDTGAVAFYVRAGSNISINTYNDLYKFRIGEVRGGSHWDKYNKDAKLKKFSTAKPEQLISMLIANRIDTFAGMEFQAEWEIKKAGLLGKILKAKYGYRGDKRLYFMLSKKSIFADKLPEFRKVIRRLHDEGYFNKIINSYR